jgi:ABC-type spermidine/putrescine transport system permease subunit I
MRNNIMLTVFGVIAVAIAFIIFPIIIEGAEETRLATNISEYTGMTSLIGIGPTLAFVVLILGGLTSTGMGTYGLVQSARRRTTRRR